MSLSSIPHYYISNIFAKIFLPGITNIIYTDLTNKIWKRVRTHELHQTSEI